MLCTSRVLSSICTASSECESADDMGAEKLATVHCTSAQQSGGGSAPATAKAGRLAADRLWKICHRAEETTEERAARLQSYIPFCARCSHQACATVAVLACATVAPACIRYRHIYIYITCTVLLYIAKSRIGRDH